MKTPDSVFRGPLTWTLGRACSGRNAGAGCAWSNRSLVPECDGRRASGGARECESVKCGLLIEMDSVYPSLHPPSPLPSILPVPHRSRSCLRAVCGVARLDAGQHNAFAILQSCPPPLPSPPSTRAILASAVSRQVMIGPLSTAHPSVSFHLRVRCATCGLWPPPVPLVSAPAIDALCCGVVGGGMPGAAVSVLRPVGLAAKPAYQTAWRTVL